MRTEILERIEGLRARRGSTVSIEEIGVIVNDILGSLNGDLTGAHLKLYHEAQELAEYIETAKAEIAAICPHDIGKEHIQVASDELDAIVRHTEEATGSILSAAEGLEALAAGLGDGAAVQIRGAVTRIYEACNFQDITGQRITRVVRALKDIDTKVMAMVATFAEAPGAAARKKDIQPAVNKAVPAPAARSDDAQLLNGPTLPEEAQTQEEIDALLADLK